MTLYALFDVHQYNIVHRDIKKQNLLLDKDMIVKLIDFGVSAAIANERNDFLEKGFGTPFHMSPQIMKGEEHTTKADIWSLAIMIYELLTGKYPFDNYEELKACNLPMFAPKLDHDPSIDPELIDILRQML